jgi:hypothetical protein
MLPLLISAVYMSSDEVDRADAFKVGYRAVCQHPNEVGSLESGDILVMDVNFVLFDDIALAIDVANEGADRGVLVGLHTYNPDAPALQRLAKLPNVLVAKNHRLLLHKLGRHARLHGRPWRKIARAAKILKEEFDHVRTHKQEGTAGQGADVPTRP